jgi:hypothetical protein
MGEKVTEFCARKATAYRIDIDGLFSISAKHATISECDTIVGCDVILWQESNVTVFHRRDIFLRKLDICEVDRVALGVDFASYSLKGCPWQI